MWDLPGPGLEPVSPALAGGLFNHCATREALYFVSLLKFSLCSFIILLSSVNIFMTISLRSLSGRLIISILSSYFSELCLALSFGTYSFVFSF